MRIRPIFAVAAALLLAACQSGDAPAPAAAEAPKVAPILTTPDAVDIHSYAKPLEARVTHVALDLNVNFEAQRVGGTATLDVQAKPGVDEVLSEWS